MTPKVNPLSTKPMLIQGIRELEVKRKLYDKIGNEINQEDTDIVNNKAQGYKIETVYEDYNTNNIKAMIKSDRTTLFKIFKIL